MLKSLYIGTSGYTYYHWKGVFYPHDLPSSKYLEFYCKYFNSVELNVTFYRYLSVKTFANWGKRTPKDFKFVIKGPRLITHLKKLKNVDDDFIKFIDSIYPLKDKIICILWQFPYSFRFNRSVIEDFVSLIKKVDYCYSIEFRNSSFFEEESLEVLRKNKIALCISDAPNFPKKEVITSHFFYLRLHGNRVLYGSEYSEDELKGWVRKVRSWLDKVEYGLIFFNNDFGGFAVKNALFLKEELEHAEEFGYR